MKIYENKLYKEDISAVAGLDLPWNNFKNKTFLISGATGMIGSCFVDVIMLQNHRLNLGCKVIVVGRSEEKARERFAYCWENDNMEFLLYDISKPLKIILATRERPDYVIHLASNTHPVAYSTDPIGTVTANIIGLKNMLDLAVLCHTKRFAFASSNEIYGENRGDVEKFTEEYCGYIDCNTLRAGYSESKRCGEALCQAYRKQNMLDVVIPRFTRTYGPTMLRSDTKAISQFILKGVRGDNIVLKSAGMQLYSYTYVCDAVAGLVTVLLKGVSGEAYNIADEASDITLKQLAQMIAKASGSRVVYELPDEIESAGYSRATKARLDGSKLRALGWMPKYDISIGIKRTLEIIRNI